MLAFDIRKLYFIYPFCSYFEYKSNLSGNSVGSEFEQYSGSDHFSQPLLPLLDNGTSLSKGLSVFTFAPLQSASITTARGILLKYKADHANLLKILQELPISFR